MAEYRKYLNIRIKGEVMKESMWVGIIDYFIIITILESSE